MPGTLVTGREQVGRLQYDGNGVELREPDGVGFLREKLSLGPKVKKAGNPMIANLL
jgi:hypothetical protein